MTLRVQLALEGNLGGFIRQVNTQLLAALRFAVAEYATRLKLQLRDDTRQGGLGDRVANAWQEKLYDSETTGLPAGMVYSKAPLIVTAFSADTTIVPKNGALWLAIPTENVPHLGGHRMTPVDVENRFNQDLIFKHGAHDNALAFVNVIPAKNGKGFRAPTPGRLKQGRKKELVLMFVMVKQVHLRQRLHWQTIMADAKEGFEKYIGEQVEAALGER